MKKEAALKNLESLFWHCVANEDFFRSVRKIGVKFDAWPKTPFQEISMKFEKDYCDFGHAYALNALKCPINYDLMSSHRITLESVKIFYTQSLSVLSGIEFLHNLSADPSSLDALIKKHQQSNSFLADAVRVPDAIESFIKDNEQKINSGNLILSLSLFPILSEIIEGFNPGRITIITAPTGFGKSNLALNLFSSAIIDNINSIFINMEMELNDIAKRFLQINCNMTSKEFSNHNYIQKVSSSSNIWMNKSANSFFTDGRSMSIQDISNLISNKKAENDISLVFVDYDQKIEAKDESEEWRFIQKAVQSLEEIAKREKVHIVLFSQANTEKDGIPRSSVRAMQPASSVIYFHKEDDLFILDFIKNRFGPSNKKIVVNYYPEKSIIKESHIKEEIIIKKEHQQIILKDQMTDIELFIQDFAKKYAIAIEDYHHWYLFQGGRQFLEELEIKNRIYDKTLTQTKLFVSFKNNIEETKWKELVEISAILEWGEQTKVTYLEDGVEIRKYNDFVFIKH